MSSQTWPMWIVLRVAARDNYICHWCNIGFMPVDPWEIDHVVAEANGGTHLESNLALCHRSCNRDKGAA